VNTLSEIIRINYWMILFYSRNSNILRCDLLMIRQDIYETNTIVIGYEHINVVDIVATVNHFRCQECLITGWGN